MACGLTRKRKDTGLAFKRSFEVNLGGLWYVRVCRFSSSLETKNLALAMALYSSSAIMPLMFAVGMRSRIVS